MDGLLCAKGLETFKKASELIRYAFQTFFDRGEVYRFRCGDLPQRQAIDIVLDTDSIYGRNIEKIDADGNEIHKLYWLEGNFAWRIEGTFPREEIVRIAKDLCKQ